MSLRTDNLKTTYFLNLYCFLSRYFLCFLKSSFSLFISSLFEVNAFLLEDLQDPGNVGTILRTADAAGFDGALLSPDCADCFSPKVLRATMGSIFRVGLSFPPSLPEALAEMQQKGYDILCSQLDGTPFYERPHISASFVLVIGNEGRGISDAVKETATLRLRLPMRGGAESLNAAVAAGIMMYDLTRLV